MSNEVATTTNEEAQQNAVAASLSKVKTAYKNTNAPSVQSAIFTLFGSLLWGPAKMHKLPSDLFFAIEDRKLPAPGEDKHVDRQQRIFTNLVRAEMCQKERWLARIIAVGVVVAIFSFGAGSPLQMLRMFL